MHKVDKPAEGLVAVKKTDEELAAELGEQPGGEVEALVPRHLAGPAVLVGIFEQGETETPLLELLSHAVPRERDLLTIDDRVWKVGTVTWAPLGGIFAVTVQVWDEQLQTSTIDEDKAREELRFKYAEMIDLAIERAQAAAGAGAKDEPEGTIEVTFSATLLLRMAQAFRGLPAEPQSEEGGSDA